MSRLARRAGPVAMAKLVLMTSLGALLTVAACGDTTDTTTTTTFADPVGDQVSLTNASGGEIGILVDGDRAGSYVNDARFTGPAGSPIWVGALDASAGGNEVIAFTNLRPPKLAENVAWTSGGDTVAASFDGWLGLPLDIWVVAGDFETVKTNSVNACIRTIQIWGFERQGVTFADIEIHDATGDPQAPSLADFDCDDAAALKQAIGFNASSLNVYYVDTVDFGSGPARGNGVWCPLEGIIALGSHSSDHLLAHEIGHAFDLAHVDTLTQHFDTSNVMHPASLDRIYLTEGQTFRAVVDPDSAINAALGLRAGLPTRDCAPTSTVAVPACPSVQKRVWADGSRWPGN